MALTYYGKFDISMIDMQFLFPSLDYNSYYDIYPENILEPSRIPMENVIGVIFRSVSRFKIEWVVANSEWQLTITGRIEPNNALYTYTYVSSSQQDMEDMLGHTITNDNLLFIGKMDWHVNPNESQYSRFKNNLKEMFSPDNWAILYLLNEPKNKVIKTPVYVEVVDIDYNNPISYKTLTFKLKRGANAKKFNYVFISVLNRYYYVQDMKLMNDYMELTLVEDVLYTWWELICKQTAFIERCEDSSYYDVEIVDDYVTMDYAKYISVTNVTLTNDIFDITDTGSPARECIIGTIINANYTVTP